VLPYETTTKGKENQGGNAMSVEELLARRRRVMGASPVFYKEPVHIVRGEGIWLYDDTDKQYMDCYNNVPCVGHCHPHIVEVIHKQPAIVDISVKWSSIIQSG
jgi:4-aminobutyrate aminotransferase-like enzyme